MEPSSDKLRQEATTIPDESRPVATTVAAENKDDNQRQEPVTPFDQSRPVATAAPTSDDKYLSLLERENEFLRSQIDVKDKQIGELTERNRETNVLVGGLQNLIRPLLGKPGERRSDAPEEKLRTDSPQQ